MVSIKFIDCLLTVMNTAVVVLTLSVSLRQTLKAIGRPSSGIQKFKRGIGSYQNSASRNYKKQRWLLSIYSNVLEEDATPKDTEFLKKHIEASEVMAKQLKKQSMDIAEEANRIHNDQQNQLQSVESVVAHITLHSLSKAFAVNMKSLFK